MHIERFYVIIHQYRTRKDTNMIEFRDAVREDCELILSFIRSLAKYEKLEDDVVATTEMLDKWLFTKLSAEVFFAIIDGREVGFALYFTNFSTFLGKAGLYLEDIYVMPEFRGRGVGSAMLKELAQKAVSRGYGRMEWSCLDWNKDSIDFYEALGAVAMSDWTTYRLTGDTLSALAHR